MPKVDKKQWMKYSNNNSNNIRKNFLQSSIFFLFNFVKSKQNLIYFAKNKNKEKNKCCHSNNRKKKEKNQQKKT